MASSGGAVGICNSAATSPGPCCKRWSNAGVACNAWGGGWRKMLDESSVFIPSKETNISHQVAGKLHENHGKSKVPSDCEGYMPSSKECI